MKKEFFAYIRPSEDEFKELWANCIFTFDANILLNFYRYKTETTNDFFDLLRRLNERIFLTYQAGEEYFTNRLTVISEQEKAYLEVKDAIQKNIEDPLQNSRKHPYINVELLNELTEIAKKIKDELEQRSKEYSQKITDDEILYKIVDIFDNKLGKPFSEERLNEIYQEGDKRYSDNIPPGFKDKKKEGIRQFGDLVLWFQIIGLAKENEKDIIFITDDEKEDWVYIHKGRTISPLPELQNEFNELTSKRFYIYNALRFIELASQFLEKEIKEETIEDVKTLQEEIKTIDYIIEDFDDAQKVDDSKAFENSSIDEHLCYAIRRVENAEGWADLASVGVMLIRHTPVDYRKLGHLSLRRFMESRGIFEIRVSQKSPNARAVDTAQVRIKPITVNVTL